MRADNMRLVKAVLVAGLYPNIARVDGGGGKGADGGSKKPKLITRTADGKSGKQLPFLAISQTRWHAQQQMYAALVGGRC